MAAERTRVLLADDNQDLIEGFRLLLELEGYAVRTIIDPTEVVAAVLEFRPAAVFLDLHFEGAAADAGLDIARALRRQPELGGLTIVAMSGYGRDSDRARTAEAGFDAHLVKPAELEQLVAIVQRAVGGQPPLRPPSLAS